MPVIRLLLLGVLILVLSACSGKSTDTGHGSGTGDGDGESAKLVGTWECVTEGTDKGVIVNFMKDRKWKSSLGGLTVEGTYSVDGQKLTSIVKNLNNEDEKGTSEIVRLTDSELVLNENGKEIKYKKK
jgi:uncharacterized protein (TIGR03066 family)